MEGKELVKILKNNGWQVDRISGSHRIMVKGNKTISGRYMERRSSGKV